VEEGCVLNSICCITQDKIAFSARALNSVSIISISLADLSQIMTKRQDLKKKINYYHTKNTEMEGVNKPLLDYSRRKFYVSAKKSLSTPVGRKRHKHIRTGELMRELFQSAVNRVKCYI